MTAVADRLNHQEHHPAMTSRIPPLLLTALAIAGCWLAARLHPSFAFATGTGTLALAAVMFALGTALSLAGVGAFRRARTTVNPLAPDATTALVTDGIYRHTRNPMYLGFLLFVLAAGTALGSWPGIAVIAPCFAGYLTRWQILPEEAILARKFGDDWHTYRRRTRRWL